MTPSRAELVARSRRLNLATLGYNALEGVVAIAAGLAAGSVALVGFGIDGGIELAASFVALWRLRHDADHARREHAERLAHRLIGALFLVLAVYVTVEAGRALWTREAPDASPVGIGLAIASVLVMPLLARAKRRVGSALGSRALTAEATQTSLCTWLSAILLAGLLLNALLGWWWADPVAALAMVPIIAMEGVEGLRGAPSCAADCHGAPVVPEQGAPPGAGLLRQVTIRHAHAGAPLRRGRRDDHVLLDVGQRGSGDSGNGARLVNLGRELAGLLDDLQLLGAGLAAAVRERPFEVIGEPVEVARGGRDIVSPRALHHRLDQQQVMVREGAVDALELRVERLHVLHRAGAQGAGELLQVRFGVEQVSADHLVAAASHLRPHAEARHQERVGGGAGLARHELTARPGKVNVLLLRAEGGRGRQRHGGQGQAH
jgi:hypothetical protein